MPTVKDMATITITPETLRAFAKIAEALTDLARSLVKSVLEITARLGQIAAAFEVVPTVGTGATYPGSSATFERRGRDRPTAGRRRL